MNEFFAWFVLLLLSCFLFLVSLLLLLLLLFFVAVVVGETLFFNRFAAVLLSCEGSFCEVVASAAELLDAAVEEDGAKLNLVEDSPPVPHGEFDAPLPLPLSLSLSRAGFT